MIVAVRRALRRIVSQPRLYAFARRAMLLGQYALKRPDEPDLLAFASLRGHGGLAVDIGANGGQTAIALAFILPRYRIVSFEPNPALWPELEFVAKVLGDRFGYRPIGLGAGPASMTLFVPCVGRLPITTRASLRREDALAQAALLEKETGRKASIEETIVEIVPFDALGLRPAAIKIDVEGYELDVLRGMRETLAACRPMLMIESNARDADCRALLAEFGYGFAWFDRTSRALVEERPGDARNWFATAATN